MRAQAHFGSFFLPASAFQVHRDYIGLYYNYTHIIEEFKSVVCSLCKMGGSTMASLLFPSRHPTWFCLVWTEFSFLLG